MTSLLLDFSYSNDQVIEEGQCGNSLSPVPIIDRLNATRVEPTNFSLVHFHKLELTTARIRTGQTAPKGLNLSISIFLLPPLIALALTNNVAVLCVAFGSGPFRNAIFCSVRLLYIALAVADLLAALFYQALNWLGALTNYFSNFFTVR